MSKKEILKKVNMCMEDIEMLKIGVWIPDTDSCDATLANLAEIKKYIEDEQNTK